MNHYGHLVRVLHCAASQAMTAALEEWGLTSAQGRIIGFLAHQPKPPCAKDIEAEFHLSHPTVSGLLSRLEKKEYVEFRPDERDGRCKRIHLLPKGWECNDQIYQSILENEERIVRGFSQQERQQFAEFLTRSIRNMNSDPDFHFQEEDTKR